MPKEIFSQHDQRESANDNESGDFFTDQWKREYHAEVETITQHPCSPYVPVGWQAPLDTPQNYFTYLRGRRTRGASREDYDLRIEYDKWIADWTKAGQAWDEEARKITIKLKGGDWNIREKGFPEEVLLSVGPRPGAMIDAVKAAKQGHPYVLGLRPFDPSKTKDVQLHAILFPQPLNQDANWMEEETVEAEKPRNKGGRPTNAERAARAAVAAGVSEEEWAK
jgi:hypothetical protein